MEEVLVVQRERRVIRLGLNRPAAGNALNQELASAFAGAVQSVVAESEPQVVLVASTGPLFCAGGDVQAVARANDPASYLRHLATTMHEALLALRESPHVIVARVHGAAAGAGLALVLNADLVIASSKAVFLSAYTGVGLTPDCGLSRLLPDVVGVRRATELVLTNRALTAAEALSWGLVNEVVEPHALEDRTEELLAVLASGPALAQSRSLALMGSRESTYGEHLAAEVDGLSAQIALDDTRSRMTAFLARSEGKRSVE